MAAAIMPRLMPGTAGTFFAIESITIRGASKRTGEILKLFFKPSVIIVTLDKSAELPLYFNDKNPKMSRVNT